MTTRRSLQRDLFKLFDVFFQGRIFDVDVRCLQLCNDYQPARGDEVITYKYKVHIIIKDELYNYEGWCYREDLNRVALGIFSHWLVKNYKIYDGQSSALYNMYVGACNLVKNDSTNDNHSEE